MNSPKAMNAAMKHMPPEAQAMMKGMMSLGGM